MPFFPDSFHILGLGGADGDTTPGGSSDVWCWEADIGLQWETGINIQLD